MTRWLPLTLVGATWLVIALLVPILGTPPTAEVQAQALAGQPLPTELQYVPKDAALFVYLDAGKVWNHSVFEGIRKADAQMFQMLTAGAKLMFGMAPEDVKNAIVFIPKIENNNEEAAGFIVTFNKPFDIEKIKKGAEAALAKEAKIKVTAAAVSNRTAVVLLNLGEAFTKPQPQGETGPQTPSLLAAATGKHTAVLGISPAGLPEVFRRDDLPVELLPYQPLLRSLSVTATVDAGKSIDLEVRVKTATAGKAVECEKALGSLLKVMIEEGLQDGIKELEMVKDAKVSPKELIAVMKATAEALKNPKFTTLGNETQLALSIPGNLPFTPAYFAAKEQVTLASDLATSSNNLQQIGLGVINYSSTMNSTAPPAAVCDKTGKPLLSWRVLILPYIEQNELFKQFKLDEAWDSPHNKKLLAKMPDIYALPGKSKPGETETYYRVFVGNGAGWDWLQGVRFPAGFLDGTSNTLMCVTAAQPVPWTKPEELEFDPEKDMRKLLGAVVHGKIQVGMWDGSSRTLSKMPSKETVNALITRAGGEVIGDDFP